jgi:hypothetical protein
MVQVLVLGHFITLARSVSDIDKSSFRLVREGLAKHVQAGPYLGILRPWAQENFAPPPPLFFRIQLYVSKNNTKN